MNAGTSRWFETPSELFFPFAQSCFFVFSFLVFRGNLIDLHEIQVTWDMRDA